ncbi:Abi family protein [Caballeronia sp. LZ008]|uniref:Abi family protein n=1 Tax=Caballeronia sp. LZ008 TaxID=3038560 RepID=UPI0028603054|nr:Abi family protein [Caballeronia sp. LZ008]MDR5798106.1 Abi family protein [Caballeronia sp. LZ008]
MPIPYAKPHLTYAQQLKLLRERGLTVDDEQHALWHLENLGYYRLSGYFYPFRVLPSRDGDGATNDQPRQRLSEFTPGSTFSQVADLYKFDQSLRLLAIQAIERLEVALRAKIAYQMASKHPCAYLEPTLLDPKFCQIPSCLPGEEPRKSNFQTWVEQHDKLIARSKEDFMKHYRGKYELPVPLWISIEVWDFGLLSYYYSGLRQTDRQALASELGIPRNILLGSWLRTISHLRNIAAHHSRLWNRSLTDNPKPPGRHEVDPLWHLAGPQNAHSRDRVYGALAVTQYLLQALRFDDHWKTSLKALVDSFPTCPGVATVEAMGFPPSWQSLDLWK